MKGFEKDETQALRSVALGVLEAQNHDGTRPLQVMDAGLAHVNMRGNAFAAFDITTVADQWEDDIELKPKIQIFAQRMIRNSTTGNVNPSAKALDLANGSGASGSGDVWVGLIYSAGQNNDNITGLLLWLKRTGSAPNSKLRVALHDVTDLCGSLNDIKIASLLAPTSGLNTTPLDLDKARYYSSRVAYSEVNFDNIPNTGNGGPVYINLNYNSRERRDPTIGANKVYAVVAYLNRSASETGSIVAYGTELTPTVLGANANFYVGSAGWTGSLANDTNVKLPFIMGYTSIAVAINQIHFYAQSSQSLGGAKIEAIAIVPDDDYPTDNIPKDGKMWTRRLVDNLTLADQKTHSIVFEGKAVVPRFYHVHVILRIPYSGTLTMELNFWNNPVGDNDLLKG